MPKSMISSELVKRFEALKRLRAKVEAAEQMAKDITVKPAKYCPVAPKPPQTASPTSSNIADVV